MRSPERLRGIGEECNATAILRPIFGGILEESCGIATKRCLLPILIGAAGLARGVWVCVPFPTRAFAGRTLMEQGRVPEWTTSVAGGSGRRWDS